MGHDIGVLQNHFCKTQNRTSIFLSRRLSQYIISVPHGAELKPEQSAHMPQPRPSNQITSVDRYTLDIAQQIMAVCDSVTVVCTDVSRLYVDCNRWNVHGQAFIDPRAGVYYRQYHGYLSWAIARARARYPAREIVLVDLHSYPATSPESNQSAKDEEDAVLGTRNRTTLCSDTQVDLHLAHHFERGGYSVFWPNESSTRTRFRGGYTVAHYAEQYKINAIQIEAGPRIFMCETNYEALRFADSMASFICERTASAFPLTF